MLDCKQIEYNRFAYKLVSVNIGVRKGEQVLIVCDTNTDLRVAYAIAGAVDAVGGEYTVSIMRSLPSDNATSTTDMIAKAAEAADVIVSLNRYNSCAIFDSRVTRLIQEKRLRDITLSCRDPQTFLEGGALADYEEILQDGLALKKIWEKDHEFRVKSLLGTDLYGKIGNYPISLGCGIAREAGEGMAFSDGEISCSPNNGTVSGTVVIDGPIFNFRQPDTPIRMSIQNSQVISIDDGDKDIVEGLREMLSNVPNFNWLAEIAVGLNPCSLKNGSFPEEKKARGNMHIALGDNVYYGGSNSCPVHMDLILKNCTMTLDDKVILDHGKIVEM